MKTKLNKLTLVFTLYSLCTFSLQARLGETADQCDSRYGKRIFKHAKDKLSFGTYIVANKKIRVLFLEDKSVIEMIITGPVPVYSEEQAAEIGASSIRFVRGLLAEAYGFTEDELKGLTDLKRISQLESHSDVQSKDTKARFTIQSDEAQSNLTIMTMIADTKVGHRVKELGFNEFMGESILLENKRSEAAEAEGF